jgi:hypothetical protein
MITRHHPAVTASAAHPAADASEPRALNSTRPTPRPPPVTRSADSGALPPQPRAWASRAG